MWVELSTLPLGEGSHLGDPLQPVLRVIEESGLEHRVTPVATLIRGAADEVWPLVRRCHEKLREHSDRVVTTVRLDDREGADVTWEELETKPTARGKRRPPQQGCPPPALDESG